MIRLAGCIIQDNDGRLLLLHRNTPKRTQWEIPGGKIRDNETPEAAAQRELLEELAVEVAILRKIGQQDFGEDGYTMPYTWFGARITAGEPTVHKSHVHDEYRYFSQPELEQLAHELSPNVTNFLNALQAGDIRL